MLQILISVGVLAQNFIKWQLRLQNNKYQELNRSANCINHIKTKKTAFFNAKIFFYSLTLVIK